MVGRVTAGSVAGPATDCEPDGTVTCTGAVGEGTGATTGADLLMLCVEGAAGPNEWWTGPASGWAATMTTAAPATAVAVQTWLVLSLSQRPDRNSAIP